MEGMKMEQALYEVETPCYVLDEGKLKKNLSVLADVAEQAGCKILLAQKAFSMFSVYPMIGQYLAGTTASGLFEAKLGYEEMGKENHIFSSAYVEKDFDEIIRICDHIIFNSFSQWNVTAILSAWFYFIFLISRCNFILKLPKIIQR